MEMPSSLGLSLHPSLSLLCQYLRRKTHPFTFMFRKLGIFRHLVKDLKKAVLQFRGKFAMKEI